jgi:hypothetical protein
MASGSGSIETVVDEIYRVAFRQRIVRLAVETWRYQNSGVGRARVSHEISWVNNSPGLQSQHRAARVKGPSERKLVMPTSHALQRKAFSFMSPHPVLEVALYTVRSPDTFSPLQHQAHHALATLPGHRAGLRLQAQSHGLFADLVAWESFEAAQRASQAVREDPRFANFLAAIEELRLYAHYRLRTDPAALLNALREAPVVELAAYTVRDVAVQHEIHTRVHDALRTLGGYRFGAAAHQLENTSQFADVIGWASPEAHTSAGAVLQQRSELAAFFSGISEMKVFELFSVLG